MSVPDPALVREALAKTGLAEFMDSEVVLPAHVVAIREAAKAWLGLEGALVIRRDADPMSGKVINEVAGTLMTQIPLPRDMAWEIAAITAAALFRALSEGDQP